MAEKKAATKEKAPKKSRKPTQEELVEKRVNTIKLYYDNVDVEQVKKDLHTRQVIRNAADIFYDAQKTRIATGNRICANFRLETGQLPGKKKDESKDPSEVDTLMKVLTSEYDLVAKAIAERNITLKKLMAEDDRGGLSDKLMYIKNEADAKLIKMYKQQEEIEEQSFNFVKSLLPGIPIYDHWLKDQKAIGTLASAVIIGYFDIYTAKYASSFCKYCGIDVVFNETTQQMEGRQKKHTVDREYVDKNGEVKKKKSITYNPFVKTKFMGVFAPNMIKQRNDYAVCYYEYKHRIMNSPQHQGKPAKQIDLMSKRYMLRQFFKDLFKVWKELEGLPVPEDYAQAKLGIMPHHFLPMEEYRKFHPELYSDKEREALGIKLPDEDSWSVGDGKLVEV